MKLKVAVLLQILLLVSCASPYKEAQENPHAAYLPAALKACDDAFVSLDGRSIFDLQFDTVYSSSVNDLPAIALSFAKGRLNFGGPSSTSYRPFLGCDVSDLEGQDSSPIVRTLFTPTQGFLIDGTEWSDSFDASSTDKITYVRYRRNGKSLQMNRVFEFTRSELTELLNR